MNYVKLKNSISCLLENFSKNDALYILGSGVSINYAKTFSSTSDAIKKDILNGGSFLVEKNEEQSDLHKLLIGKPPDNIIWSDLEFFYFHTTSNAAIENLYLKNIQPEITDRCPEYEIFNLCRKGEIFNFNHDGLADLFISNKLIKIHHPHGKFPPYASLILNQLTDLDWDYDLQYSKTWNIHLPLKENKEILSTDPYKYLKDNFNKFNDIFIIGYSFCENQLNRLNDEFSFNLILDLANFYDKRITVINPQPDSLRNQINFSLKNSSKLLVIPIRWDYLCNIVSNGIGLYPLITLKRASRIAEMLKKNIAIPLNVPQSWIDLASLKLSDPLIWKVHVYNALQNYYFKSRNFSVDNIVREYFNKLENN
jgi:hypothetical protein